MKAICFGLGLISGLVLYDYGDGHLNRAARAEMKASQENARTFLDAKKASDKKLESVLKRLEAIK